MFSVPLILSPIPPKQCCKRLNDYSRHMQISRLLPVTAALFFLRSKDYDWWVAELHIHLSSNQLDAVVSGWLRFLLFYLLNIV